MITMDMDMDMDIDIFLGLEVGKTDHWACAVTKDGTKIWNKTLPNDEVKLASVYKKLSAQGTVLAVEDQPATIGAPTVSLLPSPRTTTFQWPTCPEYRCGVSQTCIPARRNR